MFNIGDKIVYPMHGAGVIEAIEEKEILGLKKKYYIMNLSIGEMKVMIPMDKAEHIGVRQVIEAQMIPKVYKVIRGGNGSDPAQDNWSRRYMVNMEKIKSGDIFEVAEVYRTLKCREKAKGLSTGEKKMLDSVKKILISELVLVENADAEEISSHLETIYG